MFNFKLIAAIIRGNIKLNEQNLMKAEPMLKEGALQGKTVIVTGGGTGLGRSMVKYFLELGANAVICSRKMDVLE